MNEYRVVWQQRPHVEHEMRVLYVEAGSEADARTLASNHVERKFGIEWFSIHSVEPTQRMPRGRVKE